MLERIRSWLPKTFTGFVTSTLFVGLITNWLYDIFFKPGVSAASAFVLHIITLGSDTVRDAPFASAALDPRALPALFLVAILSIVPAVALGALIMQAIAERRTPAAEPELQDPEAHRTRLAQLNTRILRLELALGSILVLMFGALFVVTTSMNSAIFIWRVFNSNVAICSPYLADSEEKVLRAKFASMTTESEFRIIEAELNRIALKNNIRLVPYKIR